MLAASKTLGKIADIGGSAFGERFMDYEVPAAIELMQQEAPRHAGVLILKELARHSANYFHSHIGIVFENILVPLRDPRSIVREGAAELLAACLEIVTQRERQARTHDLSKILQDAQLGLRQSQSEVIHGSLLTYRELLLHAGMVSKLISSLINNINILALVHEGEFPRYNRSNLAFQVSSRSQYSQNGYHYDPVAGGLRHANLHGAFPSQGYGTPVNPI